MFHDLWNNLVLTNKKAANIKVDFNITFNSNETKTLDFNNMIAYTVLLKKPLDCFSA